MKRFYAEQINKMLEDYYFNLENNPRGRKAHYRVLATGIRHLCGVALCVNDDETLDEIRPFVRYVVDEEVPPPAIVEMAS